MSEQHKNTHQLKKIEATVMEPTADALENLMEQTGMTMGEAIDRLALHLKPTDPERASTIVLEEILYIFSYLDKDGFFEALFRVVLGLGACLPDSVVESLGDEIKRYKKHSEQKVMAMTEEEKAQEIAVFKEIIQRAYEKN